MVQGIVYYVYAARTNEPNHNTRVRTTVLCAAVMMLDSPPTVLLTGRKPGPRVRGERRRKSLDGRGGGDFSLVGGWVCLLFGWWVGVLVGL